MLVERGRAVGVRLLGTDGGVDDLRAGRVVLAAGTVENSRLALQALAAAGVGALDGLPGLVDKIAQGFTVTCPDGDRLPSEVRAAARDGRLFHRIGTAATRSNLFVRFTAKADGSVSLHSWTMGEQHRGPHCLVRCVDTGTWPWPVEVAARLDPADEEVRTAQQHLLDECFAALAPMLNVPAGPLEFSPRHGSPDLVDRLTAARQDPVTYSFPLGSEQHEGGTLALGELVAEDHQLRGVPGLYACGPSILPRTGAANPSMTTPALGRRLGAILARPPGQPSMPTGRSIPSTDWADRGRVLAG